MSDDGSTFSSLVTDEARFSNSCSRLLQNDESINEVDVGSDRLALREDHIKRLADALCADQRGSLRRLHLRHVSLRDRKVSADALASALKNHTTLQTLEVTDCHGDEHGHLAQALGAALSYNKSFQYLHCSNCWTHPKASLSMAYLMNKARHLTEIRLCHNVISVRTACVMAQGLRSNDSLQTLDLTGNGIEDRAIEALASGLEYNNTLEVLTLDFNAFGDKGVQALARLLTKNHSLKELHLFGNRVSAQGAEYLADALQSNNTLQSLVLSFNQIGDRGVTALAGALTVNSTLTKIRFPSNSIGKKGIVTFAEHLPRMRGLEQLDVGFLLHDEAAQALVAALRFNVRLKVLHMEKVPEEEEDEPSAIKMDFYLRLNRSGRRLLLENQGEVPLGLWAHVLAKAGRYHASPSGAPDVLHFLLQAKPELFDLSFLDR
jgi:hypothetical protein